MTDQTELERVKAEMDAARKAAQVAGEAALYAAWAAEAASYAADAALEAARVADAAWAAAAAARNTR